MTDEQNDLYLDLEDKYDALTAASRKMLFLRTPANEERVNIERLSLDLEIDLVWAKMQSLHNNAPIRMPSPDVIAQMQEATAVLANVAEHSQLIEDVIKAAGKAIEAWPKPA